MRRYADLEWAPNEIIHSPRITGILGDLAGLCVKGVSPNCKKLRKGRWPSSWPIDKKKR